ncbi:hypothetical protein B0H19DRAFT_1335738 [Mycena capillaripes]|nr:hypothetical protein B0H19DRAFT_1335738 [Mycena capillaripes]
MSLNDDCGPQEDSQLLPNTMAGLVNVPFTFECSGVFGIKQQPGPSFRECGSTIFEGYQNTDLCIGGLGQQHACTVGTCQVIDWTSAVAPPCSSTIMDYVRVQPSGLASPCCNSDACLVPDTPYTCDASRALQLCVVDESAAQCVDPATNAICSGNFSAVVVRPSGSTDSSIITGSPATQTSRFSNSAANSTGSSNSATSSTGSSNSTPSSGGHPSESSTNIIAIVKPLLATLVPVLAIGIVLIILYIRKKRRQNTIQKSTQRNDAETGQVLGGTSNPTSWLAGLPHGRNDVDHQTLGQPQSATEGSTGLESWLAEFLVEYNVASIIAEGHVEEVSPGLECGLLPGQIWPLMKLSGDRLVQLTSVVFINLTRRRSKAENDCDVQHQRRVTRVSKALDGRTGLIL